MSRGRDKSWVEFLMSVNVSNLPAILPMVSNDGNSPMAYKCGEGGHDSFA